MAHTHSLLQILNINIYLLRPIPNSAILRARFSTDFTVYNRHALHCKVAISVCLLQVIWNDSFHTIHTFTTSK